MVRIAFVILVSCVIVVLALGGAVSRRRAAVLPPVPVLPTPPAPSLTADFAVPVLMYHRICNLTAREARSPLLRDLTVPPDIFAKQMQYLVAHGFSVLTTEALVSALREHRPLPERAVVITMDDGYRDNFTEAFPILRAHGLPATVFLVTSVVGDAAHVRWQDARAMMADGCGFQSHTVHHDDLTTLDDTRLHDELAVAKLTIEAQLATPVREVAYPSGAWNTRVTAATRDTGYLAGWKKGGGPVTPDCNAYQLPRVRIHGRTTEDEFQRAVWSGVWTRRIAEEERRKGGKG